MIRTGNSSIFFKISEYNRLGSTYPIEQYLRNFQDLWAVSRLVKCKNLWRCGQGFRCCGIKGVLNLEVGVAGELTVLFAGEITFF